MLAYNKRQNGWTWNLAQMFCQTSHDPKKGLWMLKITQFFYFTFFWGGEGECISFSNRVITLCLRPVVFTREVVFCRTLDAFSMYYSEILPRNFLGNLPLWDKQSKKRETFFLQILYSSFSKNWHSLNYNLSFSGKRLYHHNENDFF